MRLTLLIIILSLFSCVEKANAERRGHLLFTQERMDNAKEKMAKDRKWREAWDEIRRKAEKETGKPQVKTCEPIVLAYLMTGEEKYAKALTAALRKAASDSVWGSDEMLARKPVWRADLGLAGKALGAALAYDAVRERLSNDERLSIAKGLCRVALEPSLGDWLLEPTRIHSINSMGHNWWTSCVGMGGILALALERDLPSVKGWADKVAEALPEWFDFEGDVLQNKPKSFDGRGGMYESVNYANFGCEQAMLFMLAWKNVRQKDLAATIPQLKNLSNFFIHVCYPRTGILYSLNLGDSHQNITATSSMVLLDALGYGSDDIKWYLSQVQHGQDRDGYWLIRPIGFLYMPDWQDAPKSPSASLSELFADFGWATIRTSWQKDASLLAVKSGYTWNHSHADANSFVLFHKGVDILKDAGHCWYPNEAYRDFFFQSQAHNVVLIDGKGQPREQQYHGAMLRGSLHYLLDTGDLRYILANGTGPTATLFSRNFRHFLWIDKVIYVIDDLKSHEPGEYQWLWHQNGKVTKRNGDVTITNGNSSVVIRPLYPKMLALSNFVHDYPDDLWMEEVECPAEDLKSADSYYSFHLPGKFDRIKALNAIMLKDCPEDNDLPHMERREGKDWIGLRIKWHGEVTDLYINQLADGRLMHCNSWIEADGWQTDAYMVAVKYKEGSNPAGACDFFVCYGSALRRGATSYFSSLRKQYFANWNGKKA